MSLGFLNERSFFLNNTAEIPMRYRLRIPDVDGAPHKEFVVTPDTGIVLPHGKQELRLEFISKVVQKYSLAMLVDVEAVGDSQLSLLITADCIVPKIYPSTYEVDFLSAQYGGAFVGYTYESTLQISNPSHLPAKCEVVDSMPMLKTIGEFVAELDGSGMPRAIVPAKGSIDVKVKFTAAQLGQMSLPMYVRIVGLEENAFTVELNANAIGPNLLLSGPAIPSPKVIVLPKEVVDGKVEMTPTFIKIDASTAEEKPPKGAVGKVDFNKAQVLTTLTKAFTMYNDSLVPAAYKLLLRKSDSPFSLEETKGTLKPLEKKDVTVGCHMDDTIKVQNDLILQIVNAPEQIISLNAVGVGATITAATFSGDSKAPRGEPLAWAAGEGNCSPIEFGETFSMRNSFQYFTLENLGRKPQKITWVNSVTNVPKEKGKDGEEKPLPTAIFDVKPSECIMEPGAIATFTVKAQCPTSGLREETLICSAQVGTAKAFPIFEPVARSTFIDPLIQPSMPGAEMLQEVDYLYTYATGDVDRVVPQQTKKLTLTNISPLALTLTLKAGPPFSVATSELSLGPSKSGDVMVSFDTQFPGDKVSREQSAPLEIKYKEHPQKDAIRLVATTQFPNLEMSPSEANFGCVLNDTQSTLTMTLTNPSAVPAHYSWSFAPQEGVAVDPSTIFDILPIKGVLAAGSSETVELTYKGSIKAKSKALALCSVVGGPTYSLPMAAESSDINYKLTCPIGTSTSTTRDNCRVDFGLQNYDRVEEKEIYLQNTGKVLLQYSVDKSCLSRTNVVEVLPASGNIQAGGQQKILVRCLPGLPEKLTETFHLQIAHFPLEAITVTVEGIYPRITLNLPRDKTANGYDTFYQAAKAKVDKEKEADERERLGLPAEDAPTSLTEYEPKTLISSLGTALVAVEEVLASWGRVTEDAAISRDEFRVLALSVLGPNCTAAVANTTFASLAATAAAATEEGGDPKADDGTLVAAATSLDVASFMTSIKDAAAAAKAEAEAAAAAEGEMSEMGLEGEMGQTVTSIAPSRLSGKSPSHRSGMGSRADMRSSATDPSGRFRVFVDSDVDYEAERLALSSYAMGVLAEHGVNPPPPATASPPATARSQSGLKRGTTAGTSMSRKIVPLLEPMPPPPPSFTLAKYVLDFGNVIKGMQRKKVFRLKNVGWQSVSLDIDKNAVQSYGIRVEPDKVVKLPGLPEPETTEFTVTFASKAGKVGLGQMCMELRLDLKPGPPVAIMVHANITLPELKINEESIDFGNVLVSNCTTHTVLMHNPKEVPAEWSVKPPLGGAKDYPNFVCTPNQGTLGVGQKCFVEITFTPGTERGYATQLVFKPTVAGSKPTVVNVTGHGKELKCVLEPVTLELPPVMPHSAPSSADFELRNNTDYPIEVYSVEFDPKYAEEEAIVRRTPPPRRSAMTRCCSSRVLRESRSGSLFSWRTTTARPRRRRRRPMPRAKRRLTQVKRLLTRRRRLLIQRRRRALARRRCSLSRLSAL